MAGFRALVLTVSLTFSSVAVCAEPIQPQGLSDSPDWGVVARQSVQMLKSDLADPESAQIEWQSGFTWGFIKPLIGRRIPVWIACGTINAKNRMGGYVGAQEMYAYVMQDGSVRASWPRILQSTCDENPGTPVNPELSAATAPAKSTAFSVADELRKLADLRDAGIISTDEFDRQKARLLGVNPN